MARTVLVVLMAVLVLMATVSQARYLPTRADDSRMEEIREILREILERTAEGSSTGSSGSSSGTGRSSTGYGYDKRFIYKRSVAGDAANMAGGSSGLSGERVAPLYNLAQ